MVSVKEDTLGEWIITGEQKGTEQKELERDKPKDGRMSLRK